MVEALLPVSRVACLTGSFGSRFRVIEGLCGLATMALTPCSDG